MALTAGARLNAGFAVSALPSISERRLLRGVGDMNIERCLRRRSVRVILGSSKGVYATTFIVRTPICCYDYLSVLYFNEMQTGAVNDF